MSVFLRANAPVVRRAKRVYCELCHVAIGFSVRSIGKNHEDCVVKTGKHTLRDYGLMPDRLIKAIKSGSDLEYELLNLLLRDRGELTRVHLSAIDQYLLLCTEDGDLVATGRRLLAFHNLLSIQEIRRIKTLDGLKQTLQALLQQDDVSLSKEQKTAITKYNERCVTSNGEVA